MILYRHSNKNNRVAIDSFLSRGSRDKKVCGRLRKSAVEEKIISFRLIISKKKEKNPIINKMIEKIYSGYLSFLRLEVDDSSFWTILSEYF